MVPVLVLLVLAPVCAEYLSAYDTTTGDPVALLGGLLLLGPLYGGPAVLIREAARRRGAGWPGIVALALAAGVVQAGVVDQSLFSAGYRGIDWWPEVFAATAIPGLGVSGYLATTFLAGHVLWSFTIPVLLTEQLFPGRARTPWLRTRGLVVVGLLYLAAAGLVLADHLQGEDDHASAVQVAGALAAAAVLVVVGLRRREGEPGPAPHPVLPAALGLLAGVASALAPTTWAGVALLWVTLVPLLLVPRWRRWPDRSLAVAGVAVLLVLAGSAVFTMSIGDVPPVARALHNAAAVALVLGLGVAVTRRQTA